MLEDLGKEAGLAYAKLLPVPLAAPVAALAIIVWLWFKCNSLDQPWRELVRWALVGAAVVALAQYPVAYQQAKDYCREQWTDAGGTSTTLEAPTAYAATKCMSVWPNGPDFGSH